MHTRSFAGGSAGGSERSRPPESVEGREERRDYWKLSVLWDLLDEGRPFPVPWRAAGHRGRGGREETTGTTGTSV